MAVLATALALVLSGWSWTLGGPCPEVDGGMPTVRLGVGTQKVLKVRGHASFRARHPGLVQLKSIGNDQVLVIGEGIGNTSLIFATDAGTQTWPVTVRQSGHVDGFNEIGKAFPCDSTLQSESNDGVIHLIGVASSFHEWRVANQLVADWKNVVLDGTLRQDVIDEEFLAAQAEVNRLGLTRVKWVRREESVTLQGEIMEDARPKLRALEDYWRPRLELVSKQPKKKHAP